MKLEREHLIFKALVALDQAIEQSGTGPIEPSHALRFALAYLYSVSDHDRENFDELFRLLQDPLEVHLAGANYVRATYGRTLLHGICKGVGFNYSLHHQQLQDARKPKAQRDLEAQHAENCRRVIEEHHAATEAEIRNWRERTDAESDRQA